MRPSRRALILGFIFAAFAALCLPPGSREASDALASGRLTTTKSYRPLANGDTFNYEQISRVAVTQNGKTTHVKTKTTETIEVSYPVRFGRKSGLYELKNTISFPSYAEVVKYYVNLATQGSVQVEQELFTTTRLDSGGFRIADATEFEPPEVIDELPERSGASWSEAVGLKYAQKITDPSLEQTILDLQDASGGYKEVQRTIQGGNTTTTKYDLHDDGTGIIADLPSTSTYTFELPILKGSAYVIPVLFQGNATDVPDWYPGGGQPLQPLYRAPTRIIAPVKTPEACGRMADMSASQVHTHSVILDPLTGTFVINDANDYDVVGMGTVCAVTLDWLYFYDNMISGKLLQKVVGSDVEILTSEKIHAPTRLEMSEPFNSLPMRRPTEASLRASLPRG